MKRFFTIMAVAVTLLLSAVFGILRYMNSGNRDDAFRLIPEDAIYILTSDHPVSSWNDLSSSSFWQYMGKHPYLAELQADANYLDSLVAANEKLLRHLNDRPLYLSAHMTSKSDYDFLFMVDLLRASKFDFTLKYLDQLLPPDEYEVGVEVYFGHELFSIRYRTDADVLYLGVVDQFLVSSYTRNLIIKLIDQKESSGFSTDPDFREVIASPSSSSLGRLYINYAQIDEYLQVYFNDSVLKNGMLDNDFRFTGVDLFLDDDHFMIEGNTVIPDSTQGYARLLQQYGNGNTNFGSVLSSRTAYAQSISIHDFRSFYNELIALYMTSNQDSLRYHQLKHKVEFVLGLSLENDFLSWIGEEIVFAQNLPSKIHNQSEDLVVAIRTNDVEHATERLAHVQKMIRNRTPARFRSYEYKGSPIYYLDLNNFFGVFFGQMFERMTKPYYTFIDDYVVFSNDPKSLVSMLEDYENGYTLDRVSSFQKVKDELPRKSAVFTYANGELAYEVLKLKVKSGSRNDLHQNKPYIAYFKSIGISYVSDAHGFNNRIYSSFSDENIITVNPEQDLDSLYQLYYIDYNKELEKVSDPENFVLDQLNRKHYVKYYPASKQIRFKCNTKDGKLHGKAREYYSNGALKAEGRYRKGRKIGRWTYFDRSGNSSTKNWEGL